MPKVTRARQSRTSSRVGAKDTAENPTESDEQSKPKRAVLGDVSNRRSTRHTNGKHDSGSGVGKVEKKTARSGNDTSATARATSTRNVNDSSESLQSHSDDKTNKRSTRSSSRARAEARSDQVAATETSKRKAKTSSQPEEPRRSQRSCSRGSAGGSSRGSRASTRATSDSRGKAHKRAHGDASAAAPKAKKPRPAPKRKTTTKPTKKAPPVDLSIGARVRARTLSRGSAKKESGVEEAKKKAAPSTRRGRTKPRSLCSDFLAKTDYKLVRRPFDASKYTSGIASYDNEYRDDVLEVSDYVTDIFQRLYNAETTTRPPLYMDTQRDINSRMRAILVDWLVEVHMKFRLVPETLYLCVNIIDRFCNLVPVERSKLQLVGVTALLIACKYEEIYPPEVRDCVYITDRAYSRQEVLDMEQEILQRLEFKMTVPTAYPFLQRFLLITKAKETTKNAANYYMERMLQEHDLLKFRPSVVAAATVTLAINNPEIRERDELPVERPGVPNILVEYTGFQARQILQCAELIADKVGEEVVTASRRELLAVKRKYDNRKYDHVSTEIIDPDIDDVIGA